jgi:hypothetical protein
MDCKALKPIIEQRGFASFCKANCSGRKDFLDRLHSIDFPREEHKPPDKTLLEKSDKVF